MTSLGFDRVTEHTVAATSLIEVENLTVDFTRGGVVTRAVDGVSFRVEAGRCHALVGESGSGKTVTARSLVGLNPESATVRADTLRFDGQDLLSTTDRGWRDLRGSRIGLVLQDALVSLDPLQTIGREVAEAIEPRRRRSRSSELRDRAVELLSDVGIPDPERRLDQYSHELSGGLRQRALIATAVARTPDVIIADEPTTALDTTVQKQIIELLRSRLERGAALILISHDLSLVAEIADDITVMQNGRAVEQGTPAEVFFDPQDPYTRSLLAAVPTAAAKGFRLSESTRRIPLPERKIDSDRVVLDVRSVSKTYSGKGGFTRRAVDAVDLRLHAGETVGVVGESGSGKTTLMRIALGLITPDEGTVLLDGESWSPSAERARRSRRSRLQLVSQDPLGSFDPRYTVGRLVADGVAAAGVTGKSRDRRVVELLESVGLDETFVARRPLQLSGGQRQRVAIARALAPAPAVLVCDEPVSALDVSVQAQVLDLIAELQARHGTSVLFVSHDLGVVHHVSDRVVVLSEGRVVETGEVGSVYRNPTHPYTRTLLDAVPRLSAAESRRLPESSRAQGER
ncbi:dipeptide ABC transporter ATP-binding protein [Rhodococcoides yunnanense]|uniref:dipeptide ABC transporter ATP-binding protein n=1 Tax=Rhodococcoides yunnanense TaxID=278209 RepID=UPI00093421B8|nr:ABC transporter ATP-binding protein [Rhodococcus yunnanensis]